MSIRHLFFCTVCNVMLAAAPGQAQERPPRLGEQPDAEKPAARPPGKEEKADKNDKSDQSDKSDKAAKKPVRRRAVPMVIDRMPGPTPPAVYGPVLTAPGPAPMPSTVTQGAAPAPVFINGCDPGGCNGSNGVRYNGVGTTLLSPQGRLCNNNGVTVQC